MNELHRQLNESKLRLIHVGKHGIVNVAHLDACVYDETSKAITCYMWAVSNYMGFWKFTPSDSDNPKTVYHMIVESMITERKRPAVCVACQRRFDLAKHEGIENAAPDGTATTVCGACASDAAIAMAAQNSWWKDNIAAAPEPAKKTAKTKRKRSGRVI